MSSPGGSASAASDPEIAPIPKASEIDPHLGAGNAAKAYREGTVAVIELGQRTHAYFSREPARVTAGPRGEGGNTLVGVEELPEEWSELFARAINSLRTSLDYLAYELTMQHAPQTRQRSIGFPITTEPWLAGPKDGSRKKIAGMAPDVQQHIEDYQPFHASVADRPHHPLAVIDELRQIYTHRRPAILLAEINSTAAMLAPVAMVGNLIVSRGRPMFPGDTPFATPCLPSDNPIRGTDYPGQEEQEYPTWSQHNFDVVMGPDTAISEGTQVQPLLHHLYGWVHDHLLAPLLIGQAPPS
jgi:hypothetical protein